ncbi:MAG TPA: M14 family zinc carboxypeptidase [Gemmatimonadaceae bacterium]|nr:M14 family zinc carboxypeptidase [Gemmatimonadaceae bacterium]
MHTRQSRHVRRALLLGFALALLPFRLDAQEIRTGAELAQWQRTTSHQELLDFLFEVQARTDRMRIVPVATTNQGRSMPLVVLGAPPPASPGAAWLSGKPTLYITGSVHGGERSGKEGALQLIRELAIGRHGDLLDRVNVLIIPSLNPDGAEAGMRTNSMGYDMNRDFVALETPEITAAQRILLDWWPDVYVDAHNGGAYPYNLTYQATLHPAADSLLVAFARGPMYEAVKAHLESQQMRMYWYSGPRQDRETGKWSWQTTEPWLRKQHSYGGFHNVLTLLYEVPGRHTLDVQAAAQREGYIGLLRFMAANADQVRRTVVDARRRALAATGRQVPLATEEAAYPRPEQFYVIQEGQPVLVTGENRTLYRPANLRARPWAYAFDARLTDWAAHLRRHGVQVERLEAPVTTTVERYTLTKIEWQSRPYQNHMMATPEVAISRSEVTFPAGTYLVRTGQNAGTLAMHLLEPDNDDSLVAWNFLDHSMPPADSTGNNPRSVMPVYRIVAPVGVRATVTK